MTASDDDILDDLFHGCAWAAYLDQAAIEQGWPDSEATRRRAYRYYEDALAGRNSEIRPARSAEFADADAGDEG
jgi:hypothetical protein